MAINTEKRNVLLGVAGSIAAYKSAELVRILVSRGYSVKVMMTEAAEKFIGKATLEALSGHPVLRSFWEENGSSDIEHIKHAQWADAIVIAPATAETISKIARGAADNPLTATVLASKAPLVIAPAMNVNMYENRRTQANIETLKAEGVSFIGPNAGALACGSTGKGRLAEPWDIFYAVRKALSVQDLEGRKIVITAGMTRDSMDIMRDATQISSTKLGVEIAREAYRRGAAVTLIHGGVRPKVPTPISCIEASVNTALKDAIVGSISEDNVAKPDMIILAGLANQFRASGSGETLSFEAPVNVLKELGEKRGSEKLPLVITFVVAVGETEELFSKGRHLIDDTSMDVLVGKFAAEPVDLESNELWLIDRAGRDAQISTTYRSRVASQILDRALRLI